MNMQNLITGEIADSTKPDQLIEYYKTVKRYKKQIEEMDNTLKMILQEQLNGGEEKVLNKWYKIKKQVTERYEYSLSDLKYYLDEDTFMTVIKPISKQVDSIIIQILTPEEIDKIKKGKIKSSEVVSYKLMENI